MSASEVTVTPLGGGRYRVSRGGHQTLAYGIAIGGARWVFFDGRVHVVEDASRSRPRSSRGHDEAALASPMPATVVMINVQPGQQVARGDLLVMLEAMKMELQVTAPRDGRVKALACRKGELVPAGVPLLEME